MAGEASEPNELSNLCLSQISAEPSGPAAALLWVDCASTNEIAALHAALMQTLGQKASRPFRPRVTLARIRASGRNFSRRQPVDKDLEFEQAVQTVELFRSPPPSATGYQILASVQLGGSDARSGDG